jgi:uncharacterized protein (DUF58 family)
MRVRPTRALLIPILGAAVLYFLVRVAGGAWLALAADALLVLPLVAMLLPPRLEGVTIRREVADRVTPGQALDVVLLVRNEGRRTTTPFRLNDVSSGLSDVVVAVPALPPGGEATISLRRLASRRGVFDSGRALLTSSSPLGLLRATSEVPVPGRHVVHPEVTRVPRIAGAATNAPGEVPLPVPGVGTEVLGLREWRSGDSARAVSARATARHGRPLVLERERDAGSALVLLAGGPGRGAAWEASVSRAASLSLAALNAGTPPLLLGAPPPPRMDRTGLLDWFAGVDAVRGLEPTALAAALRAAAGGALVVLVPPELLVDRLQLRRACQAARTDLLVLDA